MTHEKMLSERLEVIELIPGNGGSTMVVADEVERWDSYTDRIRRPRKVLSIPPSCSASTDV